MSKKKSGGTEQPLTRRQLRELEDSRRAQQTPDAPPVSISPTSPAAKPATPKPAAPKPPASRPVSPEPPAKPSGAPQRPAPPTAPSGSGPNRVSAASLHENGAGPTSEQARRAPASAALPSNLRFAPDVFSAQNGGGVTDSRITRRSIHQVNQDASQAQNSAVPEVVPPSQTSAIRRIDETGALSTITAAGEAISEKDAASAITRKSIWADRGVASTTGQTASVASSPAAPVTPIATEISESERADAAALDTATMMALADVDIPATPEQDGVQEPEHRVEPEELALPQWSAITAPDSDMSTDALPSTGQQSGDASITPVSLDLGQVDAITDQEEPVVEIDHSYTWLHYLILIAIAAVLGMVVWKIGLDPSSDKPVDQEPQTMRYSVSQTLI